MRLRRETGNFSPVITIKADTAHSGYLKAVLPDNIPNDVTLEELIGTLFKFDATSITTAGIPEYGYFSVVSGDMFVSNNVNCFEIEIPQSIADLANTAMYCDSGYDFTNKFTITPSSNSNYATVAWLKVAEASSQSS